MVEWMITVRDRDLTVTYDPVARWTSLELVERIDGMHMWTVKLPADALEGVGPGTGSILTRDGVQVAAGQLWSYDESASTDAATGRRVEEVTLGYIADTAELATRDAWQDPTRPIGPALARQSRQYDTRSGPREDLIGAYVDANLGPGALADRRLAGLSIPASRGRGGTATVTARMSDLDVLVASLAEAGGLLAWIVDVGGRLELQVTDRDDVSDDVVFGPPEMAATALLTGWTYHYEQPATTRAIVAAAGEGVERLYAQRRNGAAEDLWGRSTETSVDQRQTEIQAEVDDAMDEALDEVAPVSVAFEVSDSTSATYRRDYRIGSRVGLLLPRLPDSMRAETVREATTTVPGSSSGTEQVQVVVGSGGATATTTQEATDLTRALAAVNRASATR